MNRFFPSLLAGWLGGAALALFLTTLAAAGEPPVPHPAPLQAPFFSPVKPSEFWLGIGFRPLDEALRAQLGLPQQQGLLVQEVMPDTPAERAKVQKHDVILKADGKPLKNIQELVDAVDAAKEKELSLEIIRAGKPLTLKIKPEKRPQRFVQEYPLLVPAHPGFGLALQHLESIWPGKSRYGFRVFSPGVILPPGAPVHAPLPGDLSVTIRKHGDEPAKIDVRRGDETWSVDEKDLDSLPPEIGIHVKRMLGGVPLPDNGPLFTAPHPPVTADGRSFPQPRFVPDGTKVPPARRPRPNGEGRLEKRLEEMNGRIQRLQEMIEGLRENRPRAEGSDSKAPPPTPPKAKPDQA